MPLDKVYKRNTVDCLGFACQCSILQNVLCTLLSKDKRREYQMCILDITFNLLKSNIHTKLNKPY